MAKRVSSSVPHDKYAKGARRRQRGGAERFSWTGCSLYARCPGSHEFLFPCAIVVRCPRNIAAHSLPAGAMMAPARRIRQIKPLRTRRSA